MKENSPDTIDGLLIKVILREATEEERRQVEGWVSSREANRLYYEDFKKIWEDSRNMAVQSTVNEDEAWGRFRQRVSSPAQGSAATDSAPGDPGIPVIRMRRRVSFPWLRAAAIFFILIAASWLYYTYSFSPGQSMALRSGNATLTDTLEDGTIITLNKNSTLTGKKYFEKDARSVELTGEAFFQVAPDKTRPFTVYTKDVTIKVLGTSFNVRNSPQATEVIVETGLVLVGKDQRFVSVRPYEKALVSENINAPRKEDNLDELYNYYRTREFVCNGTPLGRLVEVLNEAYGAHIAIGDSSLSRLQLTATFSNESLDGILDIVSKTLKISLHKRDGQILLK